MSLQRDSGAVKGKLVACIVDIIICINFLSWISPSRALDAIEADSLSDVKDQGWRNVFAIMLLKQLQLFQCNSFLLIKLQLSRVRAKVIESVYKSLLALGYTDNYRQDSFVKLIVETEWKRRVNYSSALVTTEVFCQTN